MEVGSWGWLTIDWISELQVGEEAWVSGVTHQVLS